MQDSDLRTLAARASTLRERLSGQYRPANPDSVLTIGAQAERRLARWRQYCAGGDEALFQARLALDGLEDSAAASILGAVVLPATAALPHWMGLFQRALETTDSTGWARQPEDDLWASFATVAWKEWEQRAASLLVALRPAAVEALREQLAGRLKRWALPVAQYEIAVLTAANRIGLSRWVGSQDAAQREAARKTWQNHLLARGMADFFLEWSALARRLAETAVMWIEASLEMVSRAAVDFPLLHSLWGISPEGGIPVIEALSLDLSDLHDEGRSVAVVTFVGGRKVVYKPRCLQTEAHFSDLLHWLNKTGPSAVFQPLAILPCQGYGWTAFVERAACASIDGEERRAYRLGALLAVLEIVQGTDCHADNVLFSGEWPVLVDGEMLFSAHDMEESLFPEEERVLQTGILPVWQRLSSDEEMRIDASREISAAYPTAVGLGYRETAARLRLITPSMFSEPLQKLKAGTVRFTLRSTGEYARIIEQLRQPPLLREMIDASLELESLAYPLLNPSQRHQWPVVLAEATALEKGDIPRFMVEISTGCCTAHPVQRMDPARELGQPAREEVEKNRSVEILVQRCLNPSNAMAPTEVELGLPAGITFQREAERIGHWLVNQAIPTSAGGLTWLRRYENRGLLGLQTLPADLYSGATGVALFLAALARMTGSSFFADAAQRAVRPVINLLQKRQEKDNPLLSSIGLAGAGGTAYALERIAVFLKDPALLEGGLLLAKRAFIEASSMQSRPDEVLKGTSGLLLALLALHQQTGYPWLIRSAEELCCSLLTSIKRDMTGGFAHGRAGVYFALSKAGVTFPIGSTQPLEHSDNLSWCQGTTGKLLTALYAPLEAGTNQDEMKSGLQTLIDATPTSLASLCCGTCGEIEVLLLAAQHFHIDDYRVAAEKKANQMIHQSTRYCEGYRSFFQWEPGFYRGISGFGYSLLRLQSPEQVPSIMAWS